MKLYDGVDVTTLDVIGIQLICHQIAIDGKYSGIIYKYTNTINNKVFIGVIIKLIKYLLSKIQKRRNMAKLTQPNITINFTPSPKQYEAWKYLQPNECPECRGTIIQVPCGHDRNGNVEYRPQCSKCGNAHLPQTILCGGAAGGGKSYLGSCWLIMMCLRFPEIKAIVARKTLKALKASTWATILSVLREWNLQEGENYRINNLEGYIEFWNNSRIMMQELADLPSDPDGNRYGSLEATILFVDEVSECSSKAVEVLTSRLRWKTELIGYPRALLSTNPCLGWVRSRFVQDDDGNPAQLAPTDVYVPFSLFDNPSEKWRAIYQRNLSLITDPKLRERLLYGNWDFVESNEMAAYWNFDGTKHLKDKLREGVYDPMKPLISGWDFNVAPYMSELDIQIDYENKKVYVLEENLGKPETKENNTPKLAAKLKEKYLNAQHIGGIIVTGDPAGLARSTQTEDGVNNYTIIVDNMRNPVLRPRIKLLQKQPPQAVRLEFVNAIFNGYDGWQVFVDMRCRKFTEDMVYQKKNADGTKCKAKVMNTKTGTKEEKYGHLSDILDYVLVLFLNDSWRRFQNQKTTIETYTSPVYNMFEY